MLFFFYNKCKISTDVDANVFHGMLPSKPRDLSLF